MDLRSQQVRLWRYRIQKFQKINFRFSTRVGKLKTTNTTWTTAGQQRATHLQSQYTFHFLTFNFNQDCCDDRVARLWRLDSLSSAGHLFFQRHGEQWFWNCMCCKWQRPLCSQDFAWHQQDKKRSSKCSAIGAQRTKTYNLKSKHITMHTGVQYFIHHLTHQILFQSTPNRQHRW